MTFNPLEFKQAFPLFQQPEYSELIYLDNAATTQTPGVVIQAITDFYTQANANAHRSSYGLSRTATHIIEGVRIQIANLIGAASDEIIFCKGATEGFNLLASSLETFVQPGQDIILSAAEHHANLLPWRALAERKNLTLRYLPETQGKPDLSQLPSLLNDQTALVCLTLASNVLGCRLPIEDYASILKDHPCKVVLDASQAFAHEAPNVHALGCDFLVATAHKAYGPFGVGFVFGKKHWLERMPPWQLGGEMVASVGFDRVNYAKAPKRFEAGTLPLADIAGFGAAINFIQGYHHADLSAHENLLMHKLHKDLEQFRHIRLLTDPLDSIGLTTLSLNESANASVTDLAHFLDQHQIAVRVGAHCAHPLHQQLKVSRSLRLSVAPYNTIEDCEKVVQVIEEWFQSFQIQVPNPQASSQTPNKKNSDVFLKSVDITALKAHFEQHLSGQAAYKQLMQAGNLVPTNDAVRMDKNLITGCESKTWVAHQYQNNQHYFIIDSDSRLVRGLGGLILTWFQGQNTEFILSFDWQKDCDTRGLNQYLSASKQGGFQSIIEKIHALVKA